MLKNKEELKKILPNKILNIDEVQKYIEKYQDDKILIKLGGSCLDNKELFDQFIEDIFIINKIGLNITIVHGGGKSIEKKLKENNIESKWIEGLRVSDENSIKLIEEALNKINLKIVEKLNEKGCIAKSITSKDKIVKVNPISKDLMYVGTPKEVINKMLNDILANKEIPVVAPLGIGDDQKIYNINADQMASKVSSSLKVRRLLLMTDVAGVLKEGKLIPELKSTEAIKMIEDGTISGGFIPKIHSAIEALKNVKAVAILNGKTRFSLLYELFSDKGSGTLIRK